jgi:hypothetical protein
VLTSRPPLIDPELLAARAIERDDAARDDDARALPLEPPLRDRELPPQQLVLRDQRGARLEEPRDDERRSRSSRRE